MILTHNFSDLLETLCRGDDLTESEAGALFEAVTLGFRYAISWRTTLYSVFL